MALSTPLTLALLLGGIALAAPKDAKKPGKPNGGGPPTNGGPPKLPPGAEDEISEMRPINGQEARFFLPDISASILNWLDKQAMVPEPTDLDPTTAQVFRVVPMPNVPNAMIISAKQAALSANGQGLAVLGSMTLALVNINTDKFVLFTSAPHRAELATKSSPMGAILLDATQPVDQPPVVDPSQPPEQPPEPPMPELPQLDANLPLDIRQTVSVMLTDPDVDPNRVDQTAQTMEESGYPLAADALHKRADALRLANKIADQERGGTPFVIRGQGQIAQDLPTSLATHYRPGMPQPDAIGELIAANAAIGMHWEAGNVQPWQVGLEILLPLAWDARSLPKPPLVMQGNPAVTGTHLSNGAM